VNTLPETRLQLPQQSSTFFRLSKSYFRSGLKPHVSGRNSELDGQKLYGSYVSVSNNLCPDATRKFDTCSSFPTVNSEYRIAHYAFKNPIDQLS
jgi:hypothetical protein